MSQNSPKISIIIPTWNRAILLKKCLNSIFDSSYKNYEVIVVDDNSTDNTSEVIKKFNCHYIRLKKNKGVGYARNLGAKKAKGDIINFIDSDVVIKKDSLHNVIQNFKKHPEIYVMCGYKLPENLSDGFSSDLVMLRKTYSNYKWQKTKRSIITNSCLESAFFAMKKYIFNEFGGFTTKFSSSGGEDHELGHRINSKYKIYFFSNLGVYHHFESVYSYLKKLPKRSYYWGTLFHKNKKFEKRGIATHSEAVNSLLALIFLISSISSFIFNPLSYLALTLFMALFIRRRSFYYYIFKKKGIFYTFTSIPLDYLCYSVNITAAIIALASKSLQNLKFNFREIYLLLKAFTSKTPPNIGFFVTSMCNLSCKHCFYWKEIKESKNKKELTLDEIKEISKKLDTLYYLTITGGEPSLRDDLPEICELFYKNNNLKLISFHTNGMLPEKIKEHTKKILEKCKGIKMNIGIGVDGLEKTHNFIRGNNKSFKNVLKTIGYLKKLQTNYPNLDIQCCSTFSLYSKKDYLNAVDYFQNHLGISFGQTFIRGNPYDKQAKNVRLEEFIDYRKRKMTLTKKRKLFRTSHFTIIKQIIGYFIQIMIIKVLSEKRQILPCKSGVKTVVINECGEVFPCEMLNKKMGSLRKTDYNLKKILSNENSKKIIKDIKDKKCYCTHEGNMYVNLIFSYRNYPKYLIRFFKRLK